MLLSIIVRIKHFITSHNLLTQTQINELIKKITNYKNISENLIKYITQSQQNQKIFCLEQKEILNVWRIADSLLSPIYYNICQTFMCFTQNKKLDIK